MWASVRLASNALWARPGRAWLLIGAVALASALVMAMASAMQSMQATFEHQLVKVLGATDARIIHQFNGRFGEEIIELAQSWDGVEIVHARLRDAVTLIRADEQANPETGRLLRVTPMTIGVDFTTEPRFRHREFIAGGWPDLDSPTARSGVIIDPLTADALQAEVGDVLHIQRFGEPIELQVAGIMDRFRLGTLQRPLILMNRELLAEATNREDAVSSVDLILRDGLDVEAFCAAHDAQIEPPLVLEPAERVRSGFDRRVLAGRFGVLVGSILGFLCAAFIIVTGLTTGVTERQRELAVLSCIGGTRTQLFCIQLLVGLLVAVLGAVIGIPLGIGLSRLLIWYVSDIVEFEFAISQLGFTLAIIGAIAAGLIGAAYPALMASRVSPLEAMGAQAKPASPKSIVACAGIGLLLIATVAVATQTLSVEPLFWSYLTVGMPALYIGYFLLAVPLCLIVARAAGPLLELLLQLPRGIVHATVGQIPFRSGFMAGALMIGIAVLVNTWSNGRSLIHDWLDEMEFADGFAFATTGISEESRAAIADLPFVDRTCAIGYLPMRVLNRRVFGVESIGPQNITCVGFEPEAFFEMNKLQWIQGNPEQAIPRLRDGDAILVAEEFLIAKDIGVGDRLTLGTQRVQHEFEIVGVVSAAGLDVATQMFGIRSAYLEHAVRCVFMDLGAVQERFDNRDIYMLQVNLSDQIEDEAAEDAITDVAPGVIFRSGRWITEMIDRLATTTMAFSTIVAFAALVLASLGVGNVIIANIYTRRFEYGVLQAVGAQRWLIVRLVTAEVIVLVVTAAIIGTVFGMQMSTVGVVFYRELGGIPLRLVFPTTQALLGWAVLLMLALLAALPGIISVLRRTPSALLAAGRTG